jgi:hypothetical protein
MTRRSDKKGLGGSLLGRWGLPLLALIVRGRPPGVEGALRRYAMAFGHP